MRVDEKNKKLDNPNKKIKDKKGMEKMKKLEKYLLALLLLTSVFVVAAETEFVQFTRDDFHVVRRPSQNWFSAEMISLKVKGGSTVYITNYISNFDKVYDLDDVNYVDVAGMKPGFDMSADKYGYMVATTDGNGNVTSVSDVYYGQGHTKDFTFTGPDGRSVTTAGYLLGTFDEDTEIFFAMTPVSNGDPATLVDSYELVNVGGYLVSRQNNTVDQLGQIRVNFGTTDDVGHEFVLGYTAKEDAPSGQPLPGVLATALICMGTSTIASRMRKRSRK